MRARILAVTAGPLSRLRMKLLLIASAMFVVTFTVGDLGRAQNGWVPVDAPPGIDAPGALWIKVRAPDDRWLLAAVYRPAGPGPFPVLVVLDGASGIRRGALVRAELFANAGFLAVAACWQAGSEGVAYLDCSEAPSLDEAMSDPGLRHPRALIDASRSLPGASPDYLGLYGISHGGYVALVTASLGAAVHAIVADSANYAPRQAVPISRSTVEGIQAPVLVLHGTADATVDVQLARDYEQTARDLGKVVEAYYYEGVGHPVGSSPESAQDVRRRSAEFFALHLASSSACVRAPVGRCA